MVTRRAVFGLMLAGILATGTGGCALMGPAEAKSSKSRKSVPRLSPAADPIAGLAATLNPLVFADADGANVAYSPISIALALGMLRAGLTGESARQLDAAFGGGNALQDRLNAAERGLAVLAGDRKNSAGKKAKVTLDSACAVWAQKDVDWTPAYLDALADTYGAGVRLSDFVSDPDGARKAINSYVGDRTHDKITDLMTPESITDLTRIVLVNALYLKAPWWEAFIAGGDQPFHAPSGGLSAKSMLKTFLTSYQHSDNYQAVTIPYAGNEFGMTIVLPDEGAFETVGRKLASIRFAGTGSSFSQRNVDLMLPLFDLDSRVDLTSVMKSAGVTAPFDPKGDDFRPMSADPNLDLYVSTMLHRATVTIDEQGTEASAATAVVAGTTSAPAMPEVVRVVVDRPFYFVIHDNAAGMPLFVGRVMDPTAH
jgi:serine protease inhibitor